MNKGKELGFMASEIQKNRNRQYFIEAAKEFISMGRSELLTAREIGEKAGFSYATIYNYFPDINALLWHATISFTEEIIAEIDTASMDERYTVDYLKTVFSRYAAYFFRKPDVFALFFFRQLGPPPEELADQLGSPKLGMLLMELLSGMAERGIVDPMKVPFLGDLISSTIHGTLLLFFSGKTAHDATYCLGVIDRSLDFIFSG
jgi:AcrR family transcriptional regulator